MPAPSFTRRVTSMALLDYLDWVEASRRPGMREPLALPPLQRSALWRPRQVLNLWRSLLAGMPVGSFYLTRPGNERRAIQVAGQSSTTKTLGDSGFDLLDGQQRTYAMLLAVDPPRETGKCVWVQVLRDRVELHITTRAQPFGFYANGERLRADARWKARTDFDAAHPELSEEPDHALFDRCIALQGRPPTPHRVEPHGHVWPLDETVAAWRLRRGKQMPPDEDRNSVRSDGDHAFEEHLRNALSVLDAAEVALILAEPPMDAASAEWLLELFDRIGAGGTPLSGPERLFSMYKHHVPYVHDAVSAIASRREALLEPVEVARTAIRIAGTMRDKPAFWEPSPADFQRQLTEEGGLRPYLDMLIAPRQACKASCLGEAFATVSRLLRYVEPGGDGSWDIGLPAVLVADVHPELIRVLVHWAVLSIGRNVDGARADVVRFALFWHLCVTNDGKAAVNSAKVLRHWHEAGLDGTFPWLDLLRALTGVEVPVHEADVTNEPPEARDPSALRLVPPDILRKLGTHDLPSSPVLRSWKTRFEQAGDPNAAALFLRWWQRSGMLLWLQRGYLNEVTPDYAPASGYEEDRPVDLDHIQPQVAYSRDWRLQKRHLPNNESMQKAFYNERGTLGGGIGNFRWIASAVNRSDGDVSVAVKLRLASNGWISREGKHPCARDGAMNPESRDLWLRASAPPDGTWTEDRIAAWQQAVEERTVWLYECLWKEVGFDAWRLASTPA